MATINAPATLQIAGNFGIDYATSTILILDGATTLATHSTTSWTASNTGNDGTATATLANAGAETITANGTADGATITDGAESIALTVGLSGSGADLILSTLTYVSGETSTINSLVVTVPST
jgi:hypothetical protein